MKVLIEAPFQITDEIKSTLEHKANRLQRFFDKITQVNVYFKMDDGKNEDAVRAEVQVHVPGPVLFASDDHQHYMTAFNSAIDKVERQLRKKKEEMVEHH